MAIQRRMKRWIPLLAMLATCAASAGAAEEGFELLRLRQEAIGGVPVSGFYTGDFSASRTDVVVAAGGEWLEKTRAAGGALRLSRVDLALEPNAGAAAPPGSLYGVQADFGYRHVTEPRHAWLVFGSAGRFTDDPSGDLTRWYAGAMRERDLESRGKLAYGALYVSDLAGGVWWPAVDYSYRNGPLRFLFSFPSDTETVDFRYNFGGLWQAGAQIRTPGNQYLITAQGAAFDRLHYAAWSVNGLLGWGREPGLLLQAQAGFTFYRQFDGYVNGAKVASLELPVAPVFALVFSWRV